MPRNTVAGPVGHGATSMACCDICFFHASYSSLLPKMGAKAGGFELSLCPGAGFPSIRRIRSGTVSVSPFLSRLLPYAGIRLALSGRIRLSGGRPRYSAKAFRRAGMKDNGPPQSKTGALISCPCANVVTVCTATARKMEAAMSAREALRAIRFWMSVLQNTPHRDAIGYTCCAFRQCAQLFRRKHRRMAIWSMNAPVPPAQLPFIRRSEGCPSEKNTILASSPPDDLSWWKHPDGYILIYCVAATTSCTKGDHRSAIPIPTDPVRQTDSSASRIVPVWPAGSRAGTPDFRLMSLINIQHDTPAFPVDQHCFQCG